MWWPLRQNQNTLDLSQGTSYHLRVAPEVRTSGYVPMGKPARIGGQASVFKPVAPSAKSSDVKRSRGKKESAAVPPAAATPREMTFQPVHSYASQKPPVTCSADAPQCEVCVSQASSTTTTPPATTSSKSPGPRCQSETPPGSLPSPGSSLSTIPTPSSSESSVVSVTLKSASSGKAAESGYLDFDPGKPLPSADNTESSSDSVSLGSRTAAGKSPTSRDKQANFGTIMSTISGPLPVVMEVLSSSGERLQSPKPVSPAGDAPSTSAKVGQVASTISASKSGSDLSNLASHNCRSSSL
ncbi:hypothetical protein BaRGS_00005890 [Batillaria attramentaria]|uniref:Uncharacterized protein n=1 Tax=Batillaria attramentaria TaxID=370345 RepID=A0ABD0LUK9_9CAEN